MNPQLTKQQRHISREYLKVEKWHWNDGSHRLAFVSGVQKFTVFKGTREACRWAKPQMAIALSNMVDELKTMK